MNEVILSHFQAEKLLETWKAGSTDGNLSLDLGISTLPVKLNEYGVNLKPDLALDWEIVHSIAGSPSSCFVIQDGEATAIQFYSEATGRVYSLYPTAGAPSMLVSGIPMHRIKDTDPHHDTLEKISAIRPMVGQVLDTATGCILPSRPPGLPITSPPSSWTRSY
jgi:predicted methyltransferase